MALRKNSTPEPATPDEVDAEGAFSVGDEDDDSADGWAQDNADTPYPDGAVLDVPAVKKERKQTKAGRLGAAEKAVELAYKRLEKHDAKYAGAAEKRAELADALEAANRDRAEALAAFGVTVPEGN